jgi:electron transfer flavoprotein alpha subunit
MSRVLVVAEHDGHALNPATAKCVACARAITAETAAATIEVAVLAAAGQAIADEAAALDGVTKVILVEDAANGAPLAAVWAPQIAAVAAGCTHLLGPSSTFGKDLMPRIAALLGVSQLSDVMSVEGPYRFKRPIYAGNAIVTVDAASDRVVVATVRTASFQGVASNGSAEVERAEPTADLPAHTRFVRLESDARAGPDLQSAARVVSGGRGVGSAESFAMIEALAAALGAATGASRAAVDAGFVPNDLQVGQTGKIIAPALYVAVGISGAIQHVTGIKDARTIVAINKDSEAPIFGIADIGLVADLFQAVPELTAAIEARKTR